MCIVFRQKWVNTKEEQKVRQLLRATQWGQLNLSNGKWEAKNMDMMAPKISKWSLSLCLNINKGRKQKKQACITKLIRDISFPCLRYIFLSQNMICSLEYLSSIYIPSLEILDISNNCIVSLKPLRKVYFPRLKQIYIYHNCISTIQPLRQAYWNSRSLHLHIDSQMKQIFLLVDLPILMRKMIRFAQIKCKQK